MTTTAVNNYTRYYASLSVGSLQVGNVRVSSSFSSPIRFGTNAGRLIPVGSDAVVIGDNSGQKCTVGTGTTIGGSLNLQNLTTGLYNTAFGWNNGAAVITGGGNVFVGQYCDATADCTYGTAIGWSSYTRDGCTSVGAISYGGAAASSNNTNIGYSTGTIYMGSNNTAVGSFTLRTGAAGFANCCAFGAGALGYGTKTTAVDGSCAFGRSSLQNVSSGTHNSAFGYASGGTLTTGGYNALFGYNAGVLLTGSYNTVLGSDPVTTGAIAGSVALGYGVTAASNTLSIALNQATVTMTTDCVRNVVGGSTAVPAGTDYLIVSFNGTARKIALYT
jgi:hypothetical protein